MSSENLTISATEALIRLKTKRDESAWIDVRSEGEFEKGHIPHFQNFPILNNEERHLVGTCYKQEGQERAIELGFKLVTPHRPTRENLWLKQIESSKEKLGIVTCWRGGLRSKLSCEWMNARGGKTLKVEGGMKAMRGELLKTLEALPPLTILSGLTGSGKTRLLQKLTVKKSDLEGHAKHRGSTFGIRFEEKQPTQTQFENLVLLDLWNEKKPVMIEDESIRIGQVAIPKVMKERMYECPVVWVETPLEERIQYILEEYVEEPIKRGVSKEETIDRLANALWILRSKLGLELTKKLTAALRAEDHAVWIQSMLVDYYDKRYLHAFNRQKRNIIFKGNLKECESWIQKTFA